MTCRRRARDSVDEQPPAVEPVTSDAADRSDPDDVARAAERRDTAGCSRPGRRDPGRGVGGAGTEGSGFHRRGPGCAALDREESALDRHDAAEQLESLYRDDLTGVLSRGRRARPIGQAIDRAHRIGEPLVVAFVDVDHLKLINDAHGHAHGDRCAPRAGFGAAEGLRSYDVLVRYGGDEFVCALVGSQTRDRGGALRRLRASALRCDNGNVGQCRLRPAQRRRDARPARSTGPIATCTTAGLRHGRPIADLAVRQARAWSTPGPSRDRTAPSRARA